PPQVQVLSPNGHEIATGPTLELRWSATDDGSVTGIDLLLSRNGGATYETIAANVPNTGSYTWTVGGVPSNTCLLRVVAHDDQGLTGSDVSDSPWAIQIVPPPPPNLQFLGTFGHNASDPGAFGGPDS